MRQEKHYIDSIYYQLELTAKYCKYLANTVFQKLKIQISLDEYATLDTLVANGQMCQRDLAKLILKDRPSTGRILNSLEEKGYINRVADTKNNRLIRKIILTEDGKKVLDEITSKVRGYLEKIQTSFSLEKINELRLSITRFREILENEVEINI